MFIAKFNQTTSATFNADKNGQKPFIGDVLAGIANATLINGTMFLREGLEPNVPYLCENTVEELDGGKLVYKTNVIGKVSLMEYPDLRSKLGAGKLELKEPELEKAA